MEAMLVRPGAPCAGFSIRSTLNLTAAASNGSPLWNLIPWRSLNCQVVSVSRRHDSARLPSSLSVLRSRRSTGAVNDPAEDVAAELIGAERRQRAIARPRGGRREARKELLLVGVRGRQAPGEQRAEQHADQHDQAEARARRGEERPRAAMPRPPFRQDAPAGRGPYKGGPPRRSGG